MLRLTHINLSAWDPEALAQWYAQVLGLQRNGTFVGGSGVLIAFESGEQQTHGNNSHFGFEVDSQAAVRTWAERLGAPDALLMEDGHASFKVRDPEGNMFEIYWDATPMWAGGEE